MAANLEIKVIEIRAESEVFAGFHSLVLPEVGDEVTLGKEFANGAFGTVHPVLPPAGEPLVVKIFDPNTLGGRTGLNATARRIETFYSAAHNSGEGDWPDTMLALPFSVGWATVNGEQQLVAFMLDLRARGYRVAPFTDRGDLFDYRLKSAPDRASLAASFASKAAFFERIGFIHADITLENILISDATFDVQLIDLDGGCLASSGEMPFANGKRDDCFPPEMKPGPSGVAPLQSFTKDAERWPAGIIIGYLLLGLPPAFFLKNTAPKTIIEYGKNFDWPDIDQNSDLFSRLADSNRAYGQMRSEFAAIPAPVVDLMKQLFKAGLDGTKRPSCERWSDELNGQMTPPKIEIFEVSEEFVFERAQVELAWEISFADRIELEGLGAVPSVGKVLARIDAVESFTIRAVNRHGETLATTASVVPVAKPEMPPVPIQKLPELLELPELPRLFSINRLPVLPEPPHNTTSRERLNC